MEPMKTSKEIRQDFISFFEDKDHKFVRSSPVVPIDDPTLLFINAGMNQFKPIFLDQEKPRFSRAVNSQKCIRVSGKHNDLEEVGVDTYHHTFFEMLGNWSFGDYYKAEAIAWAWELLTGVWGMDKQRLWATVHHTDDEAAKLWTEVTDIPPDRVLRCGDKDNFWEMGETGPCGPCSEIHYYDGPDLGKMRPEGVNALPEYKELWNLVFIQNNRLEDGSLEDLPAKHVDTGAGLERIVAVLQGAGSNYATDLFTPLIGRVVELTGVHYSEDDGAAHQVLADHIRMLSFALADGALPGNEGRGYVVRRILRRAARFGRMLGQHEPFIYKLVDTVAELMGAAFPEIIEKKAHIEKVIRAEETAFGETLDRGLEEFAGATRNLKDGDTLPGEAAFKLYDTFGFPLDLTELLSREKGIRVDGQGFHQAMEAQRAKARSGGKARNEFDAGEWHTLSAGSGTTFSGYETTESSSILRKYRNLKDGRVEVILDKTPFYAESGGQVGDTGAITGANLALEVEDTRKMAVEGTEEIVHLCELTKGTLAGAGPVKAAVDQERRQAIRLNHTATHLLHKALKVVLGDHVNQAGSLVAPDRLRFDLTHYEKISESDLLKIEQIVNQIIRENQALDVRVMNFDAAKAGGAQALFGEKYGDEVRVVDVPGFSKELCGGAHVDRTGDIGFFKITAETALASGVRRIEAVTGEGAMDYVQRQAGLVEEAGRLLKVPPEQIPAAVHQQQERIRQQERELKAAQKMQSTDLVEQLIGKARTAGEVHIIAERVDITDTDQFKDLAVDLKHRLKSAVVVLGTVMNDKPQIVAAVTDDLKDRIPAGALVKDIGKLMGGGGGGSPILATAGGKDASRLDDALAHVVPLITAKLQSH